MARKSIILLEDGVDKRQVGYFPTPDFVSQYLFNEMMLLNPNGTKVIDPAVGKGELVKSFIDYGKEVEGYDIIDYANRPDGILFNKADFIQDYIKKKDRLKSREYNYIIMNPPYICHEHSYITFHKETLQTSFQTGTYNMFALFLEAAVEIAKDGCLIGCIVPDSILFTKTYEKLREKILKDCVILQIVLCPAYLFRNKGAYVSTCILILRKGKTKPTSLVRVSNRPSDISAFRSLLKKRNLREVNSEDIVLRVNRKTSIFTIDCPDEIKDMFITCPRVGELFKCGGGVSTGNNALYTSPTQSDAFPFPFFTNLSTRFHAIPELFLCVNYLEHSVGNRKFMIRNPEYLNHEGIICSGIGKHFYAAYLPANAISGVNAAIWPRESDLYWLLSYLNSSLAIYNLKGIIARSHMTTIGSVSDLPIPNFTDSEKKSLSRISKMTINGKLNHEEAVSRIDRVIYKALNISRDTRRIIRNFCADIIHLV